MITSHAQPSDLFSDHRRWADVDAWNKSALELHEHGPIHRIEREGFDPFWAVIGHDAVLDVERRPDVFTNGPEPILVERAVIDGRALSLKTLIHMDPPEHGAYRRLTADWFKPSSLDRLTEYLQELSAEALHTLREAVGDDGYGEVDFAADIAVPFPLQVILRILGLPDTDYARMLQLTQELFGNQDDDLQRGASGSSMVDVLTDFYAYFRAVTEDRRTNPTSDVATVIANGEIDGAPLPDLETIGYYTIVLTGGHDTTSSAMAGGMHALVEHPDQLALLQADPSKLNNAVEEMLRWTAPVRHFMRTAQADAVVGGTAVSKGDWLYLSYKAANLDPRTFDDPLRFDVERSNARDNISFGFGQHFCLGAQLARNELRALFSAVVPELDRVEFSGEPATTTTTFVGGHKTLPLRYRLRA